MDMVLQSFSWINIVQQMPPKTLKKKSVAEQFSRPNPVQSEPVNDAQHLRDDLFMNPKNMMENQKAYDKIRLLTSILAGVASGLLNANQLQGFLAYFIIHIVMTILIFFKVGETEKYFKDKWRLVSGMGSGLLIFICFWMIISNVVYIL